MSLSLFEPLAALVLAAAVAAMVARHGRAFLGDVAALAAAAWIGEETCVSFYGLYVYAPGWTRLGHVPILVAVIWPVVILSSRDLVRALFGRRALEPVLVGAAVLLDATLIETVSTHAGLWTWAEGGHLGVPLIGLLGWGLFAAAAAAVLPRSRAAVVVLAPALTHLGLLAAWWGALRHVLRGDLGAASLVGLGVAAAAGLVAVVVARRAGASVPPGVTVPRLLATALFVALFLSTACGDGRLWIQLGLVALPHVAATVPVELLLGKVAWGE